MRPRCADALQVDQLGMARVRGWVGGKKKRLHTVEERGSDAKLGFLGKPGFNPPTLGVKMCKAIPDNFMSKRRNGQVRSQVRKSICGLTVLNLAGIQHCHAKE